VIYFIRIKRHLPGTIEFHPEWVVVLDLKHLGITASISKGYARDRRITGKGLQGAIAVEVRKMDTGIA
jgi:hypothetical protein